MSRKFVFATALAVCVAIALAPAFAAGRTDDRGARSKQASARGDSLMPAAGSAEEIRQVSFGERVAPAGTDKIEALVAAASKQSGSEALGTLNQVLGLEIPEGAEGDKILGEVYRQMGEAYAGTPTKQVVMFGQALQHTSDPAARARLERRIDDLGGDVFAISFQNTDSALDSARVAGQNDTCDDPIFVTVPVALPMSIDFGDADWVAFDVAGPDGALFRIETISPNPPFVDDTDLTLYGGCVAGEGNPQLAFNDDGGEGFMSLINTDCLAPGTYYLEVGGFFDITAVPDFTLEITQTGTCILPAIDAYEPDDLRADANDIGLPTSIPLHANGWGRAKSEIQAHSIFPAGDIDNMMTKLSKTEWVSYSTQTAFPTKFNDFTAGTDDPDTLIAVYYENEPNYGGFCNDPDAGFDPFCYTGADCPPPVGEPLPGFPACIPIYFFTCFSSGAPCSYPENELAFDDDGGAGLSSRLEMCTPKPGATWADPFSMNEDWLVRVFPYSASDVFNYEVQVKNEYSCLFETENNGFFETANDLPLGGFINGIYDVSMDWFTMLGGGSGDYDLYKFDVDGAREVVLYTDGYDSFNVDTFMELFIGPDDAGNYFTTGISDDDGGPGWLSLLDVILPGSADDLLGNVVEDANYFVMVTSVWYNLNFPYELHSQVFVPAPPETEPNDSVATANDIGIGESLAAEINPTCDYDFFKVTLASDTHVNFATYGGDTTVELVDCADPGVRIACDDEGGVTFGDAMLDGCLPAGEWCYAVRAWSSFSSFAYDAVVTGGESCSATSPPTVTGDSAWGCNDADFYECP